MTDLVAEQENLEKKAKDPGRDPRAREKALANLGRHRVRFGYATAGLRDALRACGVMLGENAHDGPEFQVALNTAIESRQTSASTDPAVLASVGEALRVYARDVQLSRAADPQLGRTIAASIECFDTAINIVKGQEGAGLTQLPWLYAHRAGARMMIYWLNLVSEPVPPSNADRFSECDEDFDAAIRLMPAQYTWAIQFKAFLYALRGEGDDFGTARTLLAGLGEKVADQPTIQRSIAMLNSYTAADVNNSREERLQAARDGLNAAMRAQPPDQDEFLAPYSGAACRWVIYDLNRADKSDEEQNALRGEVQTAIETADIRARNAVSQALVALFGLATLRAKLASDARDTQGFVEATRQAKELSALIYSSPFRDLESRAMVLRDPIWKGLRADDECRKTCGDDYAKLRTFSASARNTQRAV
jgi:hypothetical protein